jgi:hypothetical protein
MIMVNAPAVNQHEQCGLIENFDYRKNIMLYIEQEKLRMICNAQRAGISEETVEQLLTEQNVNDFFIENIKIRLGIVEKKPERVRKPIKPKDPNATSPKESS